MYPLYDDEAYVIAAVVVGEDGSSSENLVYVHSGSVYDESYNRTTEEYTWTRTVIANGEEVTLREVDDSGISLLANGRMDEGKWYQVRYNSNGDVIRVEAFNDGVNLDTDTAINTHGWLDADQDYDDWNLVNNNTSGSNQYTNTLDDETAGGTTYGAATLFPLTFVDTVLYHERFTNTGLPTVNQARTLYEYNDTTSGIRIATDASIILDQERNNDGGDVYFGTGIDDLVDFLEDLHQNANGRYDYELSLLIEDGRATTVIIKDNVPDGNGGVTPPAVSTTNIDVVYDDENGHYLQPRIYDGTGNWEAGPVFAALAEEIRANGGTVTGFNLTVPSNASNAGNTMTWEDEYGAEWTIRGDNIDRLYSVEVDDELVGYVGPGAVYYDTDGETVVAGFVLQGTGTHYRWSNSGGYSGYQTYKTETPGYGNDYEFETGYVVLETNGYSAGYVVEDADGTVVADNGYIKVGNTLYVELNIGTFTTIVGAASGEGWTDDSGVDHDISFRLVSGTAFGNGARYSFTVPDANSTVKVNFS